MNGGGDPHLLRDVGQVSDLPLYREGQTLGPYQIVSFIAAGGMGQVYRARDPRMGRDVAIKVAAERFSERFSREVHAVASLNHPNICHLYDVGPNYLVMELIEGESPKGPLPLEEALRIARQIADALEAAHEKGIVHRDLKPGNIKVRPDGTVKVLDFGLAKSAEPAELTSDSPTMLSVAGMILGTAAYMSPEQARGKVVDKRADIWAFGVVLYEMLTGRRPFEGEDLTDTLASVVKSEPNLAPVPRKVRRLLAKCLEKDPQRRLRDIGDVWVLLDESPPEAAPRSARRRRWIIAAALTTAAALGAGVGALRHTQEDPPSSMKLSLATPERANFTIRGSIPQISPDGRHVVFAPPIDGRSDLWIRDLDDLHARMLPGTSGASYPFWSPDSRWVGFFTQDKLKKIDVRGGPAVTICDVAGGRGGTWNQDGVIVYGSYQDGLLRVRAAGGTPVVVHTGGIGHVERYPWFLPDGRHFLYTYTDGGVHADSLDARPGVSTAKKVLDVDTNAVYVPPRSSSPGYLLFLRERTLMVQPFDASQIQITGDPVPVAEDVAFVSPPAGGQFSASRSGTLVYAPESARSKQLTWFDRNGKMVGTVGMPADISSVAISPDGSAIAVDPLNAEGKERNVSLYDVTRGTASRLTFLPHAAAMPRNGVARPVWSPDGSRIAFQVAYSQIYIKFVARVGPEEALWEPGHPIYDWSRDGRWLIAGGMDSGGVRDIWLIPQFGDRKPFAYPHGPYNEQDAKLSPDGQWLAYTADRSKREEIYVQGFPEATGDWQISTNGGNHPVWSRDGRELYYLSRERQMMAVSVQGDSKRFMPGIPKSLFEVAAMAPFDVSKDGRFLIQVPVAQTATNEPLTVVVNWQAGLKK